MKKTVTRLFMIVFLPFFIPLNLEVATQLDPMLNDKVVLQLNNRMFLQEFFRDDTLKVEKYLSLNSSGLQKVVIVSIPKQELIVLDFTDTFKIALQTKISSGRYKNSTPRGEFKISKKRLSRLSKAYGGTMTFWNCLTPDERIGIHGLKDKSYERNLGKPASHGCIRISSTIAPVFYTLAPVGTPVFIE
ncbi:MAG TPA: L,D-transpeptidase [Candidatus Paceibacterota bacterium]|nr:L,D-transpeptidase [Candidatus Paceibacterota bacterium]